MVSACFTLAGRSAEHQLLTSSLIWALKSSGGYDLSPKKATTQTLHSAQAKRHLQPSLPCRNLFHRCSLGGGSGAQGSLRPAVVVTLGPQQSTCAPAGPSRSTLSGPCKAEGRHGALLSILSSTWRWQQLSRQSKGGGLWDVQCPSPTRLLPPHSILAHVPPSKVAVLRRMRSHAPAPHFLCSSYLGQSHILLNVKFSV